jgi:hypothetical protein
MVKTKYGHLLKKLKYDDSSGEYMTMPVGADLEGLNVSFAWGYRRQEGAWGGDGGICHVHPYGECLLFTGLDYDNYGSFPAELELSMGEEGEKYTINSPTVVALPPGVPHCPLVSTKVAAPFGFMAISLAGEHQTDEVPLKNQPGGNKKYAHLVQKLDIRDIHRKSGGNADYIAWWSGKDMENFLLNFTWAFHTGTGAWHEKDPHVHPNDEALLFVGLDPDNPDYLGAELEIAMGEEQEIHVIDTPTVVVAPKGLVHCPLITRKVEKPYGFSAICLNIEHDTTFLG